jgi:Na+:H+ antiporter
MENFSSYGFIITTCIIIILSSLFNKFSKKTNIPSVLLLIGLGIIIQKIMVVLQIENINFFPILEVFGIIGLILIVLEASLDIELKKEKRKLVVKSLFAALISLFVSAFLITILLKNVLNVDFINALIYSIPLSIMSSAIIIPSVANLSKEKKEFMVFESSLSDILGIMFFYFLLGNIDANTAGEVVISVSKDIILTVVVSFLVSYILIIVFQKITAEVKLFLLISVLVLLYSIGKLLHLSSLLTILVFGLILENRHIFFSGKLKKLVDEKNLTSIYSNFKVITLESSFVVRTFFFVVFGISISLASLINIKVVLISLVIIAIIFGFRYLLFFFLMKKKDRNLFMLSPRGLITILLFYAIPDEFKIAEFQDGILLFVILFTSLIMAYALVREKKEFEKSDGDNLHEIDNQPDFEVIPLKDNE